MCRCTDIGHSFSVAECSATTYGMPHATATNPVENRYKYSGKELTTALGFNAYDFAARLHSPAFPRFLQPDPYAESYTQLSPYTFCANDPINLTDPTGEKVYLYATELPTPYEFLGNFLSIITIVSPIHTFITVENKSTFEYYAYGSEYDGLKSAVKGRLMRREYNNDKAIINGDDQHRLKAKIPIQPPSGMTEEEFDAKVIEVAESFGNNPNIKYLINPLTDKTGNCNSSTSTILLKAGVSESTIKEIREQVSGIFWGFSTEPKPWTEDEQGCVVE